MSVPRRDVFPRPDDGDVLTRRQWLVRQLLLSGVPVWEAVEAVDSTALAHEEWDMEEERSWEQWQEGSW